MLRLIGLAVSIGLADSLNPTTIAPALYLASGDRARANVTEFTLGVFVVYLVGGAAIALGPGQLLLSLVPKPDRDARHIIEVVVGVAMLFAAAMLWRHRDRLSERRLPQPKGETRSSALLGATITAVELPTAFPYFAVIAAIVGSGIDPARQLFVLVLFNLCFVAPLLGIVATLTFGGRHADRLLADRTEFPAALLARAPQRADAARRAVRRAAGGHRPDRLRPQPLRPLHTPRPAGPASMTVELDLTRLDQVVDVLDTTVPEIVAGILANLTETIATLDAHLDHERLELAARAAHTCRNDALLVGARALLSALNAIEQAARGGDLRDAREAQLTLNQVWPETRRALAKISEPER